ncbi:MAG: hypothetical protein OEX05_10845 [Chloroflexota bacterium]|nr:hypothetical protein [Chloroflexota bacterium]
MLPMPWLLAVGLVIGLIVLIPARRLHLAGVQPRAVGLYALILWIVAMVLAIRPAGSRVLVPFLVVAYVAPFVVAPERVRRVLDRSGPPPERPPMKNVTPPDEGDDPDTRG